MTAPTGVHRLAVGEVNCYSGSAEDLIAAGLVTADQLPENRCGRRTFYRGVRVETGINRTPHDQHYLRVERRVMYGEVTFKVYKGVPAQVAARSGACDVPAPPETTARATAARFRNFCVNFAESLQEHLAQPSLEFNFDADSLEEMQEVLSELIDLLRTSEVIAVRPICAAGARVRAARIDAAFQEFLTVQGLRYLPGADSTEASAS